MIVTTIPGTEKYEGSLLVTQTAKYSNIWIAEDGREFERNDYGTFTHINKSYERHEDNGEPKNRLHSEFVTLQQAEITKANVILAKLCPTCNDIS